MIKQCHCQDILIHSLIAMNHNVWSYCHWTHPINDVHFNHFHTDIYIPCWTNTVACIYCNSINEPSQTISNYHTSILNQHLLFQSEF